MLCNSSGAWWQAPTPSTRETKTMAECTLALRIDISTKINDIPKADWDSLEHGASPFLKHGFLAALTESQSVGAEAGWEPYYITAWQKRDQDQRLVGAVVAYKKTHSYGEYIFDWSWANGSEQAGIPYYPKLVIAAALTPASGKRILLPKELSPADKNHIGRHLVQGVQSLADRLQCMSIHWLFVTKQEHQWLADNGFAPRKSLQFHFTNPGYNTFDDYLASLTSRKRKQFRKERTRACRLVDNISWLSGDRWQKPERPEGQKTHKVEDAHYIAKVTDQCYRNTVRNHGATAYLRPGFFALLAHKCPEQVQLVLARKKENIVACGLYLQTDTALYGRYWGALEPIPELHFELAYYQGIQRTIEHGLPLFEAGAQGEHKLLRGFTPSFTYSNHWIRRQSLANAVYDFLQKEQTNIEHKKKHLMQFLPYRKDASCT